MRSKRKNILKKLSNFFDFVLSFSKKRFATYGAYYTAFAILGLLNFFIPYLISAQDTSLNNQSLKYRLIATTACFF
jgi:hypothetical protein